MGYVTSTCSFPSPSAALGLFLENSHRLADEDFILPFFWQTVSGDTFSYVRGPWEEPPQTSCEAHTRQNAPAVPKVHRIHHAACVRFACSTHSPSPAHSRGRPSTKMPPNSSHSQSNGNGNQQLALDGSNGSTSAAGGGNAADGENQPLAGFSSGAVSTPNGILTLSWGLDAVRV